MRGLARILRVPDWAFVTANVTVRLKWRPFVNAENHGKLKYAWRITFHNQVFLPKQQPSNGQGSRPISCLMIIRHRSKSSHARFYLEQYQEKIVSLKISKAVETTIINRFLREDFAQTSLHDVTKIDDRTNKLFWVDKERMLGDRNTLSLLKLMAITRENS